MVRRSKAPERVAAALVAGVYLAACCSTVVRAGLSAGPFDLCPIGGFYCAILGWTVFPFGWLANPLLWAGVILLACGRSGAATVCGLLAVVPVTQWSLAWDRQGLWPALAAGYYLWIASAGLLATSGPFLSFFRAIEQQSHAESGAAPDPAT